MGFLEAVGVQSFQKGFVSFWFRVPTESMFAVSADDPNFQNIVPLVMFGPRIKERAGGLIFTNNIIAQTSSNPSGEQLLTPLNLVYNISTTEVGRPTLTGNYLPPSFVGVDCGDPTNPTLVIKIQMPNPGKAENIDFTSGGATAWVETDPAAPEEPYAPGSGIVAAGNTIGASVDFDAKVKYSENTDVSFLRSINPESFRLGTDIKVTPDHWHHVIVSMDVSTSISATGGSEIGNGEKFAVSFDDVHYHGDDLGGATGATPDTFVTDNALAASVSGAGFTATNFAVPDGTYHFDPDPVSTVPFGIPATGDYIDKIKRVEMAEFQFFSGQFMDTSVVGNRRLFVDDNGNPVPPATAKLALGDPDVLLHRSGNWKRGKDTGTSGDFNPVGDIERWRPDPSLFGPQDPVAKK